jgi:phage terminase small subunit
MGRTMKPAGTAVNPRNGRRVELPAGPSSGPPVIDRDRFQPLALEMWDAYWADGASVTQTPADTMFARIWVEGYDDYLRKKAEADLKPLVKGSMGQQVANPLYSVAKDSLNQAIQAARQLGIGAKNRADLGITLLAEKQALDDINARYVDSEGADDDPDDDPRRAAAT